MISYQLVAAMLADMAAELFAARAMVYEVARSVDAARTARSCTGARRWRSCTASEMAGRAADRATQIFGGRGYMRENPAERMSP